MPACRLTHPPAHPDDIGILLVGGRTLPCPAHLALAAPHTAPFAPACRLFLPAPAFPSTQPPFPLVPCRLVPFNLCAYLGVELLPPPSPCLVVTLVALVGWFGLLVDWWLLVGWLGCGSPSLAYSSPLAPYALYFPCLPFALRPSLPFPLAPTLLERLPFSTLPRPRPRRAPLPRLPP